MKHLHEIYAGRRIKQHRERVLSSGDAILACCIIGALVWVPVLEWLL